MDLVTFDALVFSAMTCIVLREALLAVRAVPVASSLRARRRD